jgi:hypothetical protein
MSHAAAPYLLLAWAIENRVSLSCLYGGQPRIFCSILLGWNPDGEEMILVYQFGGRTSAGRLRKPAWKCFRVAGLSRIEIIRGEWQAGARHSQRQTCVEIVDYDVNEDSPYAPRQSLGVLQGEPCPPGEDFAA